MPSRKISVNFILFSGMLFAIYLSMKFPSIRMPRLKLGPDAAVVVERIPLREAQSLGITKPL
jgi:hypothetical protein